MTTGGSRAAGVSFRQALAWAGLVMLAGLCVMALALGGALRGADRLLDRVSQSQAQLALAAQIEAEIDAFVVQRTPESAARVRERLGAYRRSIADEALVLDGRPATAEQQALEAERGDRIAALFAQIAAEGAAAPLSDLAEVRRLAALVQVDEQAEARDALTAMRRLRVSAFAFAAGLVLALAALAAIGFAGILNGVLRPLRRLEATTEALGRDEAAVAPLIGFSEFRHLAEAFNRMAAEIGGQRRALSDTNLDLERQVAERTQRLEDVDSARRLFLSRVSHELRTPATVVRGEAEVALRDPKADAARLRDALEHVVANGAFLQRRLDDLLALARSEDGRLSIRREPVDLTVIGREVAALAESYVRSSDVTLELAVAEGGGLRVIGDASWLQQALLALLDNAAKFGAGGRVRLALTREGEAAVFTVADQGGGVAAADLPHLFDSYYQTDRGRERGGAGLGLSVARWVAEQHGGAIAARSPDGEGLTIEIRLPIAGAAE